MNKFKNLILIILNVAALAAVMPTVEYDLNKLLKPSFDWLPTYPAVDLALASIIAIVAIFNISILFFALVHALRNHRRWLWLSTVLIWAGVGLIVLLLGKSFLPIYFFAA